MKNNRRPRSEILLERIVKSGHTITKVVNGELKEYSKEVIAYNRRKAKERDNNELMKRMTILALEVLKEGAEEWFFSPNVMKGRAKGKSPAQLIGEGKYKSVEAALNRILRENGKRTNKRLFSGGI